jgi:isocitrate lyase
MFQLARGYKARQMSAYVELQQAEFDAESQGCTATRHQPEMGTGHFDELTQAISGGGYFVASGLRKSSSLLSSDRSP